MKQITKEIKDVPYHLYLGCECTYWHGTMMRQITGNLTGALLKSVLHPPSNVYNLKPILRKLSSMTEEEAREVIFLMDTIRRDDPIKILKLNNINIPFWLGKNKIARYVSFNALNPNQFTLLLSKGFDLFGLIESGLALDKDNL